MISSNKIRALLWAGFGAALLCTPVAAATDSATRPPLNIIPKHFVKVTPFARRGGEAEKPSARLPELVPGGAALRRPVRSVAALPGGRGPVQIGALGHLEETDIGIGTGFGVDLWRGSRMSTIGRLLPLLPSDFELPMARQIAVTLLTSPAAPPPGLTEGDSFFALRLARLLALGEIEAVVQLADMTGAGGRDAGVAKVLAETRLAIGDVPAACSTLGALGRLETTPQQAGFAIILRAYCYVKAGDMAAASLTLDLAREAEVQDALALDALFALTTHSALVRDKPAAHLSVMQAVLLGEAGAGLFAEEVARVPMVLLAQAAKNPYHSQAVQLLLAERAVAAGRLAPDYLHALAQMVELWDTPETNETSVGVTKSTAPLDVILRARQIRVLDAPVTEQGQILALTDIFSAALQDNYGRAWPLAVTLTAPLLTRLSPSVESVGFAPYAVPALVRLGEMERAQAWVDMMLVTQNNLPSAASRNLQGLIRLMQRVNTAHTNADAANDKRRTALAVEDEQAVEGVTPMEAILMGAVLETGRQVEQDYIRCEMTLLPLFGYALPDFLARKKLTDIKDKGLARHIDNMDASLARGQKGDALLHALLAIGRQEARQEGQTLYDMAAMGRVLDMLQHIGLGAQAQALAKQILVRQAAHLAQN